MRTKNSPYSQLQSITELKQFIEVANASSFSKAARRLNQTPAAISASIKRLEKTLKVRLLERSTRSVRLTQEGTIFYQSCINALQILEDATEEIASDTQEISGKIVISAPTDFMQTQLSFWLQDFQSIHKHIAIEVRVSDSLSNLVTEPIDLAIRYGFPNDSSYVARLLKDSVRIACAAPEYLKENGTPEHPNELLEHNCLCYQVNGAHDTAWRFFKGEQEVKVNVNTSFCTDDSSLARAWAVAGKGIVYKSELDLLADLSSGRLVRLLPDYTGSKSPLYVVYPGANNQALRTKTLIDYLFERLKNMPTYELKT